MIQIPKTNPALWTRQNLAGALALGTLAAHDALGGVTGPVVEQDLQIMKLEGTIRIEDRAANDPVVHVYIATSELTDAELEEAVEMQPESLRSVDQGLNQRWRSMKLLCGIPTRNGNLNLTDAAEFLFDHSVNIMVVEGEQLRIVAYNTGAAALVDGSNLRWQLTALGQWKAK